MRCVADAQSRPLVAARSSTHERVRRPEGFVWDCSHYRINRAASTTVTPLGELWVPRHLGQSTPPALFFIAWFGQGADSLKTTATKTALTSFSRQSRRFIKAARTAGASKDEREFDENLRRIARMKAAEPSRPPKGAPPRLRVFSHPSANSSHCAASASNLSLMTCSCSTILGRDCAGLEPAPQHVEFSHDELCRLCEELPDKS